MSLTLLFLGVAYTNGDTIEGVCTFTRTEPCLYKSFEVVFSCFLNAQDQEVMYDKAEGRWCVSPPNRGAYIMKRIVRLLPSVSSLMFGLIDGRVLFLPGTHEIPFLFEIPKTSHGLTSPTAAERSQIWKKGGYFPPVTADAFSGGWFQLSYRFAARLSGPSTGKKVPSVERRILFYPSQYRSVISQPLGGVSLAILCNHVFKKRLVFIAEGRKDNNSGTGIKIAKAKRRDKRLQSMEVLVQMQMRFERCAGIVANGRHLWEFLLQASSQKRLRFLTACC